MINEELEDTPGANYKLILKQWHFSFKKIPNSHDFYFDIIAPQFEILETRTLIEVETLPTKILEDEEIKFYFEEKKRREIENLLKMNMRIKTTPSKSSLMKESYSTASNLGGGKITPAYSNRRQSISRLATPGKFSISKSRDDDSDYGMISNPFWKDSGVQRPTGLKKGQKPGKFLTIEELMDVPIFIPTCFNVRVVRQIPSFLRTADLNISEKKGLEFTFQKKRKSQSDNKETEIGDFEEGGTKISFDDVKDGIKNNLISWNDLTFNRECLNYLERNVHVLD